MLQKKNREINIFNLSMMDVISGAMGAFLIIVILLSRYYNSDPANRETVVKIEEELKQALARLGQAVNMMELKQGDVEKVISEIRAANYNINSAQEKLKDVQEQLDQAKSNLDRLEDEKADLEKTNKGLEARRPFLMSAWWTCPEGNVDIYLQDDSISGDGKPMPPFDPDNQQWSYWTGDLYVDAGGTGKGTENWMTVSVYPDIEYRLYAKLDQGKETADNCSVSARIFSQYFETVEVPSVQLSKTEPWQLVGTFKVNEDRKVGDFHEATAQEREDEKALVAQRLEDYRAVKEMREARRKEQKLEDPNAHKKEEKQMDGTQQKKPFWRWW